jgi:hypothetical protein
MEHEAWPEPHAPQREPLPRVEELPVAEHGYERESVKAAFDAFYRHAAQLDAALRTLEAVDSFHRQAAALRADLRSLRAAGWTQQPSLGQPSYSYGLRAPREGVPPAVWRIAGEVLLLVAVAVALGVAKVSWWVIVAAMAGAFLLVCMIEWLAARGHASYAQPASAPSMHPVVEARPGEATDEHDSLGWTAFEEAQAPSDAMTIIGEPPRDAEPEVEVVESVEEEPVAAAEPEREASPEPAPEEEVEAEPDEADLPPAASEPEPPPTKSHWWQRKPQGEPSEPEAEPPEEAHVQAAPENGRPEEQTEEGLAVDEQARRRFRRR